MYDGFHEYAYQVLVKCNGSPEIKDQQDVPKNLPY